MVSFKSEILKFGKMGEKTGWTYLHFPAQTAQELNPGNKKSFRIKGKLDEVEISGLALIPVGEGDFILSLNAGLRKKLKKQVGKTIEVLVEIDLEERRIDTDFEACLEDNILGKSYFDTLVLSHKMYFSNWISEAKTIQTKEKRITQALTALCLKMDFAQMIRSGSRKGDY